MKLTWNKKNLQSAKKRPFGAVSRFPNLPFDQQDEGGADNAGTGNVLKEGEVPSNQESALTSRRDSPSDSDAGRERLAQSFQAHGDKFAEVRLLNPSQWRMPVLFLSSLAQALRRMRTSLWMISRCNFC